MRWVVCQAGLSDWCLVELSWTVSWCPPFYLVSDPIKADFWWDILYLSHNGWYRCVPQIDIYAWRRFSHSYLLQLLYVTLRKDCISGRPQETWSFSMIYADMYFVAQTWNGSDNLLACNLVVHMQDLMTVASTAFSVGIKLMKMTGTQHCFL